MRHDYCFLCLLVILSHQSFAQDLLLANNSFMLGDYNTETFSFIELSLIDQESELYGDSRDINYEITAAYQWNDGFFLIAQY